MNTFLKTTVSIVVLCLIFIGLLRSCQETGSRKAIESLYKALAAQKDSASKYKDMFSSEHLLVEKTKVEKAALESLVKEQEKRLGVKAKHFTGTSVITSSTEIKLKVDTHYVDRDVEVWKTPDSVIVKLRDTLIRNDYSKRKWFLGRKHDYVDIYNTNSYNKLTGIYALEVVKKNKRFSATAGVSYIPFINKVYPSFSVGYTLFRF